jgi:5-dehydro-4-deoxyglucarate dehydratase
MSLHGLLFFPVTPFAADGSVDVERLRIHIDQRIAEGAGCVFAACGTGEFNSLATEEILDVAENAVAVSAGRVPVFVGVGSGSSTSSRVLTALEQIGVDGLLLLPPYLVTGSQQGLVDYVAGVAAATSLDIIVYQRGAMVFDPGAVLELSRIPNIVGLKDGVGDLARMQATVSVVRKSGDTEFMFFNGLPTAEITMRAYKGIGVAMYSSAVFAFAPDIAMRFFEALRDEDEETIELLLNDFYIPYISIRDRGRGYHVSLVKAAVRVGGERVGGVRPPLTEPAISDVSELSEILTQVRSALALRTHGTSEVDRTMV